MLELNNHMLEQTLTLDNIIAITKVVDDTPNAGNLSMLAMHVVTTLKVPVTRLAQAARNKNISIILDSMFNDLGRIMDGDRPVLEKYLIDNNNVTVRTTANYTGVVYDNVRVEMLALFKLIGVRQTALLYLLVQHHMG